LPGGAHRDELQAQTERERIADAGGFLEQLHTEPALIDGNPDERAITRMLTRHAQTWSSRCRQASASPRLAMFKGRIRTKPAAAADFKAAAWDGLARFDARMGHTPG
jgi:hypothetical protein